MYPGILSIAGSDMLVWYGAPQDFPCICIFACYGAVVYLFNCIECTATVAVH